MRKLGRKTFAGIAIAKALLSIGVLAVSTFTWFKLNSQPLQTSVVSGSGNVSIVDNSTYGYKINPTLGPDGKPNYSNTTVTKKNGSQISTENNNLEGIDTNFDIPDAGIGYYLVEENAESKFTYSYNDTVMATKFISKTGSSVNSHYIASKALSAKKYRVKKYTFRNNKTVYEQVPIKTTNSSQIALDIEGENATYDITVNTAGTYKIWLTYSSATQKWDLSLEDTTEFSVDSLNQNLRGNLGSPEISKMGTYVNDGNANFIHFRVAISIFSGWGTKPNDGDYFIHLFNGDSNYNGAWLSDAEKMAKTDDQNFYTYTYYYSTNKPAKCIFYVQGKWDNGNNSVQQSNEYNLSSVNSGQTVDITGINGGLGNLTVTLRSRNSNYTYYFENYYNTNSKIAFSGTIKYYAFCTDGKFGPETEFGSAKSMTHVSGNVYSCSTSSSYSHIIFIGDSENGPTQTTNIAKGSDGQYWIPSNISDNKFTGAWKNADTGSETRTFYLLDYTNAWSSHYCYAYGNTTSAPTNNGWPGVSMTSNVVNYTDLATGSAASYTYYSVTISTAYPYIVFNDGGEQKIPGSGGHAASTYAGKYFVMTGSTEGNWYGSIDAVTSSNDSLNTYRIFDKDEVLTSFTYQSKTYAGTPHAHAWFNNVTSNTKSATFYVNPGTTWPGLALSPVNGMPHVYEFEMPSKYVNFILNNGKENSTADGAFQTGDLLAENGDGLYDGTSSTSHAFVQDTSEYYYVLKGNSAEPSTSGGITYFACDGYWVTDLEVIELKVVYFIKTGTNSYSRLSTTLCPVAKVANDFTYNGEAFSPSITTGSQILDSSYSTYAVPYTEKADSVNGVLYTFSFDSTLTWYTNEDCTTAFTNGSAISSGSSLYCRAYCDISTLNTFYVDASHSGTGTSGTYWQNISVCGSGGLDTPYFSSSDIGATWKIGTNLYRITMPSNYDIRIANSGYSATGGNNTTSVFNVSSTLTSDYLVINTASSGQRCSVTACGNLATNIGTAKVFISTDGGNTFDKSYEMSIGDQESNDFVYEGGIQVAANSQIYVQVTETNEEIHYYKFAEFIDSKPTYVKDGEGEFHNIEMTSYTGNARFNFYLTHADNPEDRKVSVTMVPDYGNGYYIMPYHSSLTTNTYSGAIKMSSGDELTASYSGFYAAAGSEFFIRSYLNAVDTLYTDSSSLAAGVYLGTSDGTHATSPGVLHFTNAGYYDIDVYLGRISVSSYTIEDFFKLNSLNSSSVASSTDIKNQITSLVLEVQFQCKSSYKSKMTLTANNGLSDFVGAALYCTTSGGKLSDPYNYLRSHHYNDISSTDVVIQDSNSSFVIPPNSESTFYAYILIDYLPTTSGGDYTNFLANCGSNIYFYLNAVQYNG